MIDPNTVKNKALVAWVEKWAAHTTPDSVVWCDGSQEEADKLFNQMIEKGMCIKLNEQKRPGSYYFRSDPRDVARVESRTFICSKPKADAGPNNNEGKTQQPFQGLHEGAYNVRYPVQHGPHRRPHLADRR